MPLLLHTTFRTPVGSLIAVACRDRLCFFEFEGEVARSWLARLRRHYGETTLKTGTSPVLARAELWLERYFAREFDELPEVALDPPGNALETKVWEAVRTIPLGHPITEVELAARLGKPRAVRSVARALRRNPFALIVPAHRVLGKSSARRKWLLTHEGGETPPPYKRIQRVPGRSSSGKNSRTSLAVDR